MPDRPAPSVPPGLLRSLAHLAGAFAAAATAGGDGLLGHLAALPPTIAQASLALVVVGGVGTAAGLAAHAATRPRLSIPGAALIGALVPAAAVRPSPVLAILAIAWLLERQAPAAAPAIAANDNRAPSAADVAVELHRSMRR